MEERRQNAKREMDGVRVRNGRITPKQKEFLSIHDPELLETIISMQGQLGQSVMLYVSSRRYLYCSQSLAYTW